MRGMEPFWRRPAEIFLSLRAVRGTRFLGWGVAGFVRLMAEKGTAGASVLVVDVDRPAVATRISWLRSAGYDVSGATTFEEATQLLDKRPPTLLVVTLRLGAFNGVHVVLRGRARNPHLAAIVLGNTLEDGAAETKACGAVFGLKPQMAEQLLALVATALTASPT